MADLIQLLAGKFFFPMDVRRTGSTTLRHLQELEKSQFLSRIEIRNLQLDRLIKLLRHAYKNCPYYTDQFNQRGFNPEMVTSLDDLLKIPILTKHDIQQNMESIRAANYFSDMLVPNKTGGSTGKPLHFYHDKDRMFSRQAATFRHNRWAGWDIGIKAASLWGHRADLDESQKWKVRLRNLLIDRMTILDTSSITKEKLIDFHKLLKKARPEIYIAYANAIYLFARFLKEKGISDYHRPRAIITSAEVLEESQRKLIETVFECKVFDRYGSRETSVIASECNCHSGLHIGAEGFMVEFIKNNQSARPGELGKIVITDLLNMGMPFIRYQIEDIGAPSDKICDCGRGLPLMKMAAGRVTDFLVTSEGKIISGAALTIYLIVNTPGVAQAQLVQNNINEIVIKIVKGEKFGEESTKFLQNEIPKYFGNSIKYSLEFVDSIPVESSGKYRFSISNIDPAGMF
jgi:phenylacetate-CoA ligase